MGLDDQCVNSGGAWCVAASAWSTDFGKVCLLVMLFCIVSLLFLVVGMVRGTINAFLESKKGDL